jgi:hypothetical protein
MFRNKQGDKLAMRRLHAVSHLPGLSISPRQAAGAYGIKYERLLDLLHGWNKSWCIKQLRVG